MQYHLGTGRHRNRDGWQKVDLGARKVERDTRYQVPGTGGRISFSKSSLVEEVVAIVEGIGIVVVVNVIMKLVTVVNAAVVVLALLEKMVNLVELESLKNRLRWKNQQN